MTFLKLGLFLVPNFFRLVGDQLFCEFCQKLQYLSIRFPFFVLFSLNSAKDNFLT